LAIPFDRSDFMRAIRRDKLAAIGLVVVIAFFVIPIFIAIFGTGILPYNPIGVNMNEKLQPPSWRHIFGTDALGRDIFSRMLYATIYDVPIPIIVVLISVLIGGALGVTSGYIGSRFDQVIMRITDVFLAFPGLILAMAIAAALGPGLIQSTYALIVTWWPKYTRLTRGEVLQIREMQFIEASKASGSSSFYTITRHIVPNIVSPIMAYVTLDIGNILLLFSVLSYIGLGVQPPFPEWGALVNNGQDFLQSSPWLALVPGIAIVIVVVSISLVGDALRDVLDPRTRNR